MKSRTSEVLIGTHILGNKSRPAKIVTTGNTAFSYRYIGCKISCYPYNAFIF